MISVTVPNRPFSTDAITGLMLPDGIFEASLGQQRINAHFTNVGAAPADDVNVYIESVSHPGIVFAPHTYTIASLDAGASRALSWEADFSGAPPGEHRISFIEENASGFNRTIKKIFVTRTQFDPTTRTFSAQTPEGVVEVRFKDLLGPKQTPCCRVANGVQDDVDVISLVAELFREHDPKFEFCLSGYLPQNLEVSVTPNPPYPGQYGDLPFQDPWWKIVLCVVAVILLIAAAIVEANSGSGSITVTTGGGTSPPGGPPDCCGVSASGGGTSYVAAGLVAGAAAAATLAAYTDERDPFRRGEDNTVPIAGELTTGERLESLITYPEPVALGRPFAVGAEWEYTRFTTGSTYTHKVAEINTNTHVLSSYNITAPDVVRAYKGEPFIVQGEFLGPNGEAFRGSDLFVQCILAGPNGEYRSFVMQDDGISPDEKAQDGVYTGMFDFARKEERRGRWMFFVIAQDVNTAQPSMEPEEAAKIVGGMILTHQLTITFDGGTCPLVPDGDVNVI